MIAVFVQWVTRSVYTFLQRIIYSKITSNCMLCIIVKAFYETVNHYTLIARPYLTTS